METPLTPLDFARRAGKLHGARLPSSTASCDSRTRNFASGAIDGGGLAKWVSARRSVATICPNTTTSGAVLRRPQRRRHRADELPVDGGRLRLHGHPQRREGDVCDSDYLELIDNVRRACDHRALRRAGGARSGWLAYETLLQERAPASS